MQSIIEIEGLTKYYGNKKGIEDLNLYVRKGEIFGFLGPNGAGKTTTIRILLDFIRATRGKAKILGYDVHKDSFNIKKRTGYLPSEFGLPSHLRVGECLHYFSKFSPRSDTEKTAFNLAERFCMEHGKKIKSLSHGMRQKMAIILAFMKDPDLLILDEPTQGLDPLMQETFYKVLLERKQSGKTVFFSSHLLSEVEKVCERCAIIKNGMIIEVEEVSRLKERKFKKIQVKFRDSVLLDNFNGIEGVHKIEQQKDNILTLNVQKNIDKILKEISRHEVEDIVIQDPSLEEIFLEYYR